MIDKNQGQNQWNRCWQNKVQLTMHLMCRNICISNTMLILLISVLNVQCTDLINLLTCDTEANHG